MELNNRGLFEMDDPELNEWTPEDFKWFSYIGVAVFIALLTTVAWHFFSGSAEAAEAPKPPGDRIVISGTIEDVQMFRANDDNCAVLIKFRDGRLLKTWCVNYNYSFLFHVGKYNNVILDCNGNGGIASVEYEPGITD